jgi:acyl transferase domain-containing protein
MAWDALDSMRIEHASVLAEEAKTNESLRDTLSRYLKTVEAAEKERDDLRDVVVQLTEKSRHFFIPRSLS